MDLQSLGNLGEFISGLAVVISLVYVALQVRQNTQSLRTENYARALDRVASMQSRLAKDGDLARLLVRQPGGGVAEQRLPATARGCQRPAPAAASEHAEYDDERDRQSWQRRQMTTARSGGIRARVPLRL